MRHTSSPLSRRSQAVRFGPASLAAFTLLSSLLLGRPGSAEEQPPPSAPEAVDFNRDIRPILSENCYQCHGPDKNHRKAGLRLDVKEEAFKILESGDHAIVVGDLEKSALIHRITTTDEDDHMPPSKSGKKLTSTQIDTLKQWVK